MEPLAFETNDGGIGAGVVIKVFVVETQLESPAGLSLPIPFETNQKRWLTGEVTNEGPMGP
jgi:hypothetical protein